MRAITLWQPWASLMAEGVKTIETRGKASPWRAAIGETIAIHAAARWPDRNQYFPPLCPRGCWRDEENCPGHIAVVPTITDPAHQRPHRTDIRDRVPRASQTPTIFWPRRGPHAREPKENGNGQTSYAPLGAVLATGRLADVVPMVDDGTARNCIDRRAGGAQLTLRRDDEAVGMAEEIIDVSAELPYGTFEPGRWALLFDGIEKLPEPIPAVGHQGLWALPGDTAVRCRVARLDVSVARARAAARIVRAGSSDGTVAADE